jgi:carbamoyl-phosphate synthase large subunit
MLEQKRIFVTGGSGVIGLELVPRLIESGATVLVGDLKPEPAVFSGLVSYRRGDLNGITLEEVNDFGPQIIIHLAATFERSNESLDFWEENFHHNVALSHHLMTLAQECPSVGRVVFASSYLVYDQNLYQFSQPQKIATRLQEGDRLNPRNLTGMAKLAAEMELNFLSQFPQCNFSTVSARITRGYGRNSRDVISRWVRALIRGQSISVFRPEGIFDYIYAADSAEGLIRLAVNQEITGPINLGTGRSRSVAEVLAILDREFCHSVVVVEDSTIAYEASEANIDLLMSLTGWSPEYDLERAILEIIEYEREQFSAR